MVNTTYRFLVLILLVLIFLEVSKPDEVSRINTVIGSEVWL